ncbi:RCC2 protein, partial [Nothoprocta pentlandii]|nr:RCC2 protein [Nothoprocta pentlandii]
GRNEKGQLGHGDTRRVEAPRLLEALGGEAVVQAACGRNHTLALTESGSVFAFGENKMGQLGLGNQTDAVPSPTQIMYNGQPITKLACGAEFSMIMDCKGNLYSFGCPEYGQLGTSRGREGEQVRVCVQDCCPVPLYPIYPYAARISVPSHCTLLHPIISYSIPSCLSHHVVSYPIPLYRAVSYPIMSRLILSHRIPCHPIPYPVSYPVIPCSIPSYCIPSHQVLPHPIVVCSVVSHPIPSLPILKSSIIVAADESTISWGPSPTFGELGYGDHKPKSSTAAQEVKTLDGIYTEQVAMGYSHSLVIARDESDAEKERLRKLPEYNPRTL